MLGILPQPGARASATVVNTTAMTVTGTLDVVDAGGMVMAYAVLNDNLTNDGYVVVGNIMNAGLGMGSGPGMGM